MKEIKGNLITLALQGNFDMIIHGCNCYCTMGSGIAKEVRERIPTAWQADQYTEKGNMDKLGTYSSAFAPDLIGGAFKVINAYTQFGHNPIDKPFNYEAFILILKKLNYKCKEQSIGIPQIGTGLAGGNWTKIKEIIKYELRDMNVIIVYFDGSKK